MVRFSYIIVLCLCCNLLFSSPTQLHYYRPVSQLKTQPSFRIVDHKAGHCIGQSTRIVREDAWRCMADGMTYDPCFEYPGGDHRQLLCVSAPWREEGVVLIIPALSEIDRQNQKTLDMSTTLPWAVILHDDDRCLATDHQQQIKEHLIIYQCQSGAVLYGYLQRCHREWTIIKQLPGQAAAMTTIQAAWF